MGISIHLLGLLYAFCLNHTFLPNDKSLGVVSHHTTAHHQGVARRRNCIVAAPLTAALPQAITLILRLLLPLLKQWQHQRQHGIVA